MTLPLAILLPFLLASSFGLSMAYILSRTTDAKRAFLWAIVVGLVGGAVGPALLSASILTSEWFVGDLGVGSWLSVWVNVSTFLLVPLLSAATAVAGTRAFAYRRARRVRQG